MTKTITLSDEDAVLVSEVLNAYSQTQGVVNWLLASAERIARQIETAPTYDAADEDEAFEKWVDGGIVDYRNLPVSESWVTKHAFRAGYRIARQIGVSSNDGWQPIETAPKDGRCITIWFPSFNAQHSVQWRTWANNGNGGWVDSLEDCEVFRDDDPPEFGPTLWGPLPAPPQQGSDDDAGRPFSSLAKNGRNARPDIYDETATEVFDQLANDPDVWLTHGLPSETKAKRIVRLIANGFREALSRDNAPHHTD
jgi:hypothetical protein